MLQNQLSILSENISSLRKVHGYTLNELSEKANVSIAILTAIEHGRSENISIKKLDSIATALHTNIGNLLQPPPQTDLPDNTYNELQYQAITETYYPPKKRHHQITTFVELATILPLLNFEELYNSYSSLGKTTLNREDAFSKMFDSCWRSVPDSPAKQYAQTELDHIQSIINRSSPLPYTPNTEGLGYKEYQEFILNKRNTIHLTKDVLARMKIFFNDLSENNE